MAVTFKDVIGGLEVLEAGEIQIPVKGLHYDSRQVQPGFIFVCIKGFQADGHNFIKDALLRGAAGVVLQEEVTLPPGVAWARVRDSREALAKMAARFYGYPSEQLFLCGVTGTNGKTTTTHLIETIMRASGQKTGLIGTVWNKIGEQVLPVAHTTPESLDLQAMLREMVDAGVRAVAMEVSSHGLVLQRVASCQFDAAVFTNLTQDHLDFHQTMEQYLEAKSLLFKGLGRGRSKKRPCYGVVNLDDPAGREIAHRTAVPVVTYGIKEPAMIRAEDVRLQPRSSAFTLAWGKRKLPINLPLAGEFNVYNSLAAVAVGLEEGIDPELIKGALEQVKGVPGRFEQVDAGQQFTVIVDYAHTPDGLENVLQTARAIKQGRLITVFGCGGDRDAGKRPEMGRIAGELSDLCVITSDNPRSEDPEQIARQIEAGIKEVAGASYTLLIDRRQAIAWALHEAREGDLVVIAGKGHETYQIVGDRRFPFDDRQVAREILEKEIVNR